MKVLLTGANGFVGSHILDVLCSLKIPTAILLRQTSSRKLIEHRLTEVEVRLGSLDDISLLKSALKDVTHIIHCAGLVRAIHKEDFFKANRDGTHNLVMAANEHHTQLKRFLLISSLAAIGPSEPDKPKKEEDPPAPVSIYGESKLAAEKVVLQKLQVEFTILRPPGVYGERDGEFLRLFKAVKNHIFPEFSGGRQQLSLVYAKDLADVTVKTLLEPRAAGKIFFVAHPEITTSKNLAEVVAKTINTWTVPLCLPVAMLYPVCLAQEIISRITGKPDVLDTQKYREFKAPAWICDVSKLRNELGIECRTNLSDGIAQTYQWYKQQGWL